MCDLFGTQAAAQRSADAAAKAEQETKNREAKRQADIAAGNTAIDSAFSQYNPSYYKGFADSYQNNYNPQIDKQYGNAVGQLTSSLAGRGMLDSSVGAAKFGVAKGEYNDARTKVAHDAQVAAGDLQGKVAARKTDLYSLNQAAADPQGAAANAVGAATALTAPPAYSELGNLFTSTLGGLDAYNRAKMNALPTFPLRAGV